MPEPGSYCNGRMAILATLITDPDPVSVTSTGEAGSHPQLRRASGSGRLPQGLRWETLIGYACIQDGGWVRGKAIGAGKLDGVCADDASFRMGRMGLALRFTTR